MKKILTLCGTLAAVAILGTACSHSKNWNEGAAADSTLIPREGTTPDPITREHVAPARSAPVVALENNTAPRDTNPIVTEPTRTTTEPARTTTEPTAAMDDANLGASSSGRGR